MGKNILHSLLEELISSLLVPKKMKDKIYELWKEIQANPNLVSEKEGKNTVLYLLDGIKLSLLDQKKMEGKLNKLWENTHAIEEALIQYGLDINLSNFELMQDISVMISRKDVLFTPQDTRDFIERVIETGIEKKANRALKVGEEYNEEYSRVLKEKASELSYLSQQDIGERAQKKLQEIAKRLDPEPDKGADINKLSNQSFIDKPEKIEAIGPLQELSVTVNAHEAHATEFYKIDDFKGCSADKIKELTSKEAKIAYESGVTLTFMLNHPLGSNSTTKILKLYSQGKTEEANEYQIIECTKDMVASDLLNPIADLVLFNQKMDRFIEQLTIARIRGKEVTSEDKQQVRKEVNVILERNAKKSGEKYPVQQGFIKKALELNRNLRSK